MVEKEKKTHASMSALITDYPQKAEINDTQNTVDRDRVKGEILYKKLKHDRSRNKLKYTYSEGCPKFEAS